MQDRYFVWLVVCVFAVLNFSILISSFFSRSQILFFFILSISFFFPFPLPS